MCPANPPLSLTSAATEGPKEGPVGVPCARVSASGGLSSAPLDGKGSGALCPPAGSGGSCLSGQIPGSGRCLHHLTRPLPSPQRAGTLDPEFGPSTPTGSKKQTVQTIVGRAACLLAKNPSPSLAGTQLRVPLLSSPRRPGQRRLQGTRPLPCLPPGWSILIPGGPVARIPAGEDLGERGPASSMHTRCL